jgi:alkanesulfonate monooxygenase SsuD/methylene tetrahydromethanopterin reductase-like flavin-dependent oxidoreductase (luciferase family)
MRIRVSLGIPPSSPGPGEAGAETRAERDGGAEHDRRMTLRLGFAITPDLPPERFRPLARDIERAGFDELWVWEDCFAESGIAAAALALGVTEHVTVGIGLMPAPLRTVALAAMEIATLERAIPGRLIAGVGHGVQSWMEQAGVRVESPITLLREYTVALRRLLAGERVSFDGRYVHLDGVQLTWPPAGKVPLMLGGRGPVSLRLAGELGDGILLASELTTDEVRASVETARESAGGDGGPVVLMLVAEAGEPAEIAARLRDLEAAGVTTVVVTDGEDDSDVEGLIDFYGREVRPLLA